MAYIPDWDLTKIEPNMALDREWFFNVLNTLDPSFFPKIIEEMEERRKRTGEYNPALHTVAVIPELVDIIEAGVGRITGRGHNALRALAIGSKSRKPHTEREPYVIKATISSNPQGQSLFAKEFM